MDEAKLLGKRWSAEPPNERPTRILRSYLRKVRSWPKADASRCGVAPEILNRCPFTPYSGPPMGNLRPQGSERTSGLMSAIGQKRTSRGLRY
jgi:hypothetical protein